MMKFILSNVLSSFLMSMYLDVMCSLEKESLGSNSSHSQRLYNFSLFMSISQRFISPVSFDGAKQNIVLQYPPCYKDISFWISESFTENNFCEVVRGIAGDLVEEVHNLSF